VDSGKIGPVKVRLKRLVQQLLATCIFGVMPETFMLESAQVPILLNKELLLSRLQRPTLRTGGYARL
jgi:hypothetical protein